LRIGIDVKEIEKSGDTGIIIPTIPIAILISAM
jgi:hypothetical protein